MARQHVAARICKRHPDSDEKRFNATVHKLVERHCKFVLLPVNNTANNTVTVTTSVFTKPTSYSYMVKLIIIISLSSSIVSVIIAVSVSCYIKRRKYAHCNRRYTEPTLLHMKGIERCEYEGYSMNA